MEKFKILVIVPISSQTANSFMPKIKNLVKGALYSDFTVKFASLPNSSTPFIESHFDEFFNTKEIIKIALASENSKIDGVFIDCFTEPGIDILKELLNIPVVGGFSPSIATALLVAKRFSIITMVPNAIPMLRALGRKMDISDSIISITQIGIPLSELVNESKIKMAILEKSKIAVQDGAEAIILGCTGMGGISDWLQNNLKSHFGYYIPVIDPTIAAIGMLQLLIKNNLKHSSLNSFYPKNFHNYKHEFKNNS